MDVATAVGGTGDVVIRSTRVRLVSLGLALMLAATMLLVVQQRAEAATGGAPVAAAVATPDAGAAQISITAIVCPILLSIRNAFADAPFFDFVEQILNQLLVGFGCAPS